MLDFGPIDDDEKLYRRLQEDHVDCNDAKSVHANGMRPTKRDVDGLSLFRADCVRPEALAGQGRLGKHYYVACLRAGDVRALQDTGVGLSLRPDDPAAPGARPGHCVIPELDYAGRKASASESLQHKLARAVVEVLGPFAGGTPP